MTSVTWNGREVQNPILRFIVATVAICFGLLGVLFALLVVALLIVLLPITIPLHFLLRACNRKGFFRNDQGKATYSVDVQSFRRR